MLASILRAAGLRATAAGNVGTPSSRRCWTPSRYDVLAVELSSFQLHWHALDERRTPRPCLNVAPDHLDWHGSLEDVPPRPRARSTRTPSSPASTTSPTRYRAAGQGGRRRRGLPGDRLHPRHAGAVDGRASSTTSWPTAPSSRSGSTSRGRARAPSPTCAATRRRWPRTTSPTRWPPRPWRARYGVAAGRRPRRAARLPPRRAPHRRRRDASTASATSTTPRPPTRTRPPPRCRSFEHVVWVAGGLLKGADVDDLVERGRDRLRGVVLIGADRDADRRGPCATRAGCPGRRRRPSDGHWCHGRRRRARPPRLRPAGRHRAARAGGRVDGHVRQLRRPRRRLRRGRAASPRADPEGPRHREQPPAAQRVPASGRRPPPRRAGAAPLLRRRAARVAA